MNKQLTARNEDKNDIASGTEEKAWGYGSLPAESVQGEHSGVEARDLHRAGEDVVEVTGVGQAGGVDGEPVVHEDGGDPPHGRSAHATQ